MKNNDEKTVQHLAVIMDGSRRWARKNALDIAFGYSKGGVDAVKCTIEFCLNNGVSYLSLYAFSSENANRPEQEKNFLFDLIITQARSFLQDCQVHNIRIMFVGDRSLFPASTLETIEYVEKETISFSKLQVAVLFYYGAQQEIIAATQAVVRYVQEHKLDAGAVTKDLFKSMLWTYPFPFPDLIIRTGNVQRLSNFLLYQAAYSELYFLDIMWPEITHVHLQKAFDAFYATYRTFGR